MSFSWVALLVSAMVSSAFAGPSILSASAPLQVFPGAPLGVQGRVLAVQNQPKPYEYGYEFGDGLGMTQHRREVADGTGAVKGGYGYTDPIGVYRKVEYTADAGGYRAVVHSNEPGTANQATGDAVYIVELPPPAAIAQGIRVAALPQLSV